MATTAGVQTAAAASPLISPPATPSHPPHSSTHPQPPPQSAFTAPSVDTLLSAHHLHHDTPSRLVDDPPLRWLDELRLHRYSASFIQHAGLCLELPSRTILTTIQYYSRCYSTMLAYQYYPPLPIIQACMLVACKATETPDTRLRDLLNVTHALAHPSKMQPAVSHTSMTPSHHSPSASPPATPSNASATAAGMQYPALTSSSAYWQLKDTMLLTEQLVLRVIGYRDLQVQTVPQYVLHIGRWLECSLEAMNVAYSLANDTYSILVNLQYPAHVVACACIYLAAEMLGEVISVPAEPGKTPKKGSGKRSSDAWWTVWGSDALLIEDICSQMLDLYELHASDTYQPGMDLHEAYELILRGSDPSLPLPSPATSGYAPQPPSQPAASLTPAVSPAASAALGINSAAALANTSPRLQSMTTPSTPSDSGNLKYQRQQAIASVPSFSLAGGIR